MINSQFLSDFVSRSWTLDAKHGMQATGLFVGNGPNAIEVVVARASFVPSRRALLESWRSRRGRRAAPVVLVVTHPSGAALCGATGEQPPVYFDLDIGQTERLCSDALAQPNRHAALRFLSQAMPSFETDLPGLNNVGLLALHELRRGVPARTDLAKARSKADSALGKRGDELLRALGFRIERIDNLTSLLHGGDRRMALAVTFARGGVARSW